MYMMAGRRAAMTPTHTLATLLYFGCTIILHGRTPILWRYGPAADILQPRFCRRSVAAEVRSRGFTGALPEGITRRLYTLRRPKPTKIPIRGRGRYIPPS